MRHSDSLKAYADYFQSQLAKVDNCSEDVSALAFINGLRVTHPLYKYLVKYVTVGVRSCNEPNHTSSWRRPWKTPPTSLNRDDDGEKSKPHHGGLSVDNQGRRRGRRCLQEAVILGPPTQSTL